MSAGTKCSHCEEVRHCRCSYADCPWDVDQANEFLAVKDVEIARLQEQVETLRKELDEMLGHFTASEMAAIKQARRAEAAEAERDRLREMTLRAADQCDKWVKETYDGGWSTHQVRGQHALAESLRLAALQKEPQP